jgi:hypothetical protein
LAQGAAREESRPPAPKATFPPGHFYSPVPDPADLEARAGAFWGRTDLLTPGIDYNDASHEEILRDQFPRFMPDYTYPEHGPPDAELTGFYTQNSEFSWLDSRALFVLLRAWQPRRIIEVGSGYSSLLMADVNVRFLGGGADITCIEPFPRPFLRRPVPGIARLIQSKAQEIPVSTFQDLGEGDLLFIDSSHVSKTGSDVNWLVLTVLPQLRPGVRVHVHDIWLPQDYPRRWVVNLGYHWNEQYLLHALLARNSAVFRVRFGCNYANLRFPDLVKNGLGSTTRFGFGGASFWFDIVS